MGKKYKKVSKERFIKILKVLLEIDNIEIIKFTIESFIDELEGNSLDLGDNDIID
jgi:hypothetical protein